MILVDFLVKNLYTFISSFRAEEKCLVRSGLVHLLDKLCSLANLRSDTSDTQSVNQKVSTMAWAGFQVLANRCVMWETEDGKYWEKKYLQQPNCPILVHFRNVKDNLWFLKFWGMFSILLEMEIIQSKINIKSPVLRIWHAWLHVHVYWKITSIMIHEIFFL